MASRGSSDNRSPRVSTTTITDLNPGAAFSSSDATMLVWRRARGDPRLARRKIPSGGQRIHPGPLPELGPTSLRGRTGSGALRPGARPAAFQQSLSAESSAHGEAWPSWLGSPRRDDATHPLGEIP